MTLKQLHLVCFAVAFVVVSNSLVVKDGALEVATLNFVFDIVLIVVVFTDVALLNLLGEVSVIATSFVVVKYVNTV